MRLKGTVEQWQAERGYGFVRSEGTRYFLHVRDWRGDAPPEIGQPVEFDTVQVGGKGPRAIAALPLAARRSAAPPAAAASRPRATTPRWDTPSPRRAPPRRPAGAHSGPPWFTTLLALAWAGLVAHALQQGRGPLWLAAALAGLNLATYLTYAWDKSAARDKAWRTSENTLHLLALLGGWPAAAWAQHSLRHKSRKQPFRAVYAFTVALNLAATAAWSLAGTPIARLTWPGPG